MATTSASAYYFTDGELRSDQMRASRVLWGAAETEVAVAPIVSESSGDVVGRLLDWQLPDDAAVGDASAGAARLLRSTASRRRWRRRSCPASCACTASTSEGRWSSRRRPVPLARRCSRTRYGHGVRSVFRCSSFQFVLYVVSKPTVVHGTAPT